MPKDDNNTNEKDFNRQILEYRHYFKSAEYTRTLDIIESLLQKKIDQLQKLEIKIDRASTLHRLNRLDDGLDELHECLQIYEQLDNKISDFTDHLAHIYLIKGNIMVAIGDMPEALKLYGQGLSLISDNNPLKFSLCTYMGNVFRFQGKFRKALETYEQVLNDPLANHIANEETIAILNANIGLIYRYKGQYKQADEYFKTALAIFMDIGEVRRIASVLTLLIINAIDMDRMSLAKEYFNQLAPISNKEVKRFRYLYLLSKGMMLKAGVDEDKKLQALEIFEEIIADPLDPEGHIEVMYHYCDLLLEKLYNESRNETISKVNSIIQEVYTNSIAQNNHIATIKSLILQSRVATINKEKKASQELLDRARSFAKTKEFYRYDQDIDTIRDAMMKDLIETEKMIAVCANCKKIRDKSGQWDYLDKFYLANYLNKMTHTICPPCTQLLYGDILG